MRPDTTERCVCGMPVALRDDGTLTGCACTGVVYVVRRVCPGPGGRPCLCYPPCRVEVAKGRAQGGWQTARRPDCKHGYEQARVERRPLRKSNVEQTRRREAVEAHVATHDWVCLGDDGHGIDDGHSPHPCMDLTADHVVPVALGGEESGPLRVMCRSRNSQLGSLMVAMNKRKHSNY